MKTIATAAALLLAASAGPAAARAQDPCKTYADTASAIMRGRQNGMAMAKMIELNGQIPNADARDLARALIVKAYDVPRLSLAEDQAGAVTDFENDAYLQCVKGTTG